MSDVTEFYTGMVPIYDTFFDDWEHEVASQAAFLSSVLETEIGPGRRKVLDASCGIGTQALGLARAGHDVTGTDISEAAIDRARSEALKRGLSIEFSIADFRQLSNAVRGPYDAVVIADNSFAHLLTQPELEKSAAEISLVLKKGGIAIVSIRDYEPLRRERPIFTSPRVQDRSDGRYVSFQVWDWIDEETYMMSQYLVEPTSRARHFKTQLRALLKSDVEQAFASAGFTQFSWRDNDFYQPVFLCRRGN